MTHLLRTRSFAAVGVVLVGAGLIAVACGSDSRSPSTLPGDTTTNNLPNAPGNANGDTGNGNNGNANGPGTGTNPAEGNNPPAGSTTPTTGNEGPMGNIPVEQNPPTMGGTGNPTMPTNPAPTTGLAPNCEAATGAVPNLTLEQVATGLTRPLYVTQAPGDDTRLFILEKAGTVRVVQDGQLQPTPFINVGNMLNDDGNSEQGLLGMAFHPDFATNGLFYLHFSSNGGQGMGQSGDTVVAEFKANADHSAGDPASRRILLTTAGLEANHNGGQLAFGPDKMLYFGLGDGGGANDQHGDPGNGQSLNVLNAKILRLDPLGRAVNNAYSIPPGNLTAQGARQEIWAYGLRNPWRFSFDACNGDLYIGDVGQNTIEEIDFLPAAADRTVAAGTNFGWRLMEGPQCRPGDTVCNAQTQAQMGLKLPVDSYGRTIGQSVTGGYVYRGSAIPGLRGTYIYADYQSARFFRFRIQNGAIADRVEITAQMKPATGNIGGIASFGSDNAGEMYVAAFTPGAVYRVAAAP